MNQKELQNMEELKYPIGRFENQATISLELWNDYVETLRNFPGLLKQEAEGLSEQILNTPYRPDGWTIRQVVHHCADSHINCLMRLKLALTEENPTIKPYLEDKWAKLPDSNLDLNPSMLILEGVHQKIVCVIESLNEEDLKRTYIHPEHGKTFTILELIALYAWHCKHHLAHVQLVTKANK